MVTYKWSLRKGGKKMRCPQCGQMRFVPFVLTEDGKTMAGEDFGRCDREQSCGYFRYPDKEAKATVQVEPRPELPPALFSLRRVWPSCYPPSRNTLFKAFSDLVGTERLNDAFFEYKVGTTLSGYCIYPQYDGAFLRTAKAIVYDENGHRRKDSGGESLPVCWLHKTSDNAEYMKSHHLKQCFFGQHLLKEYPTAKVYVVEAEKTAVLMAATDRKPMKKRIWLACGGSQMLKGSIDLMPLIGRDVTLIPDDGQFWNWKRTADAYGWRCLDIKPLKELHSLPDGCDIWDCVEDTLRKEAQQ